MFHSSRISLSIHVERHSGNRRALFLLLAVPFVADAFQPRQLHALWFLLPSLRRSVPVPPSVVRDARNRRIRLLPRPRRASRARAATVAPFRSTFARARPVANRFTKTRVDAPIPRIARRRARSRRNNLTRASFARARRRSRARDEVPRAVAASERGQQRARSDARGRATPPSLGAHARARDAKIFLRLGMARDRRDRASRADGTARANPRGRARARGVVVVVAACAAIVEAAVVEDATSRSIGFVATGEDAVVRARVVTDRSRARTRVSARCAKGWEGETRVEARDDGRWPDDVANDGVYAAKCSTDGLRAGERVRWRWEVESPERAFAPTGRARYYGTVLEKDLRADTSLSVVHVFAPDYWKITTDEGERVGVYFEGRYYDDVLMRRRGSNRKEAVIGVDLSAANWPKHKFKLDFHGRVFKFDENERKVEEINLQSHYQEPGEETYLRENLGFAILRRAGVPASLTKHVQVRVNNEFYGLFSLIEQVDSTFLRRNYLDPEGALYKAVNWKYSNLRAGDPNLPCPYATPDYKREWMNDGCPEIYRKASKANRDNWDDLWELTQVIERVRRNPGGEAYLLYDHTNLPALVNEMAAQTLMLGADRCTKNYYMHKDWTGEWSRIPWDVEDVFPGDKRYGIDLCKSSECDKKSTAYCILSCEKFNSPLYCDRNHPQDIFYAQSPEQDPRSTYNVLIDVMLAVWPVKEMYFTRLRTLMDEILATSFIDDYARRTLNIIRKDALRDSEKWGVGAVRAIDQGVLQLLSQIVPKRRDQLFNQYSSMIPSSTPSNARVYVSHAQKNGVEAYVKISNPNGYAVDVSFWIVETRGGWKYTLKPGTVLGAGRTLFVVRDAKEFRRRATWARREYPEGVFVQGNFQSDLDTDDVNMISVTRTSERVAALNGRGRAFRRFRPRVGFDNTSCALPDVGPWSEYGDCCAEGKCGLWCGVQNAARVRRRDVNITLGLDPNDLPQCLVHSYEIDRRCASLECGTPRPPNSTACRIPSNESFVRLSRNDQSVIFSPIFGLNTRTWEDWSYKVEVAPHDAHGVDGASKSLKILVHSGGGLAFRATARNDTRLTSAHFWIARHAPPQPLPRLVFDLESTSDNTTTTRAAPGEFLRGIARAQSDWNAGCYVEIIADFAGFDDSPTTAAREPSSVKIVLKSAFGSPTRLWLGRAVAVFSSHENAP